MDSGFCRIFRFVKQFFHPGYRRPSLDCFTPVPHEDTEPSFLIDRGHSLTVEISGKLLSRRNRIQNGIKLFKHKI